VGGEKITRKKKLEEEEKPHFYSQRIFVG